MILGTFSNGNHDFHFKQYFWPFLKISLINYKQFSAAQAQVGI